MKIKDIIEAKGYETDTVRICKFLGFDDTNQLKGAKFFSQEQSYSRILIPGLCMSNGDCTWRLCQLNDGDCELHSIDYGYKFQLEICDGSGYGRHLYYQSDFLSLLEDGFIIYAGDGKGHIRHIKWTDEICDGVYVVHEADVVVKED